MSEVIKFKKPKPKRQTTIARKINRISAFTNKEWQFLHQILIYLEYLEESKIITRKIALKETHRLIRIYYENIIKYIDRNNKD